MAARNPHSVGTFELPILWNLSARNLVSSQPSVAMVFHTRSITSSRTYKNPDPFVDCNHLCGLDEYISQPRSCKFKDIIPGTCAPSTADKIPFDRASAHSSLAGSTTP